MELALLGAIGAMVLAALLIGILDGRRQPERDAA